MTAPFFLCSDGSSPPPPPPPASSTPATATAYGAHPAAAFSSTRKSTRRDEENGQTTDLSFAPNGLSAEASWPSLEDSESAAQRAVGQQAGHHYSHTHHHHRGQQQQQQQQLRHPHRMKRRKMEPVSFASLQKEIFMYLDTVASTQREQQQQQQSHQLTDMLMTAAEEGTRAEEDEFLHHPARPFHSPHNLHHACVPPHSRSARGGGAPGVKETFSAVSTPTPLPRVPPLLSVEGAVEDTLRVLRACWDYRGAPYDAFEPVRHLSPVTVHLLLTYGHHTLTHSGDYVVLRGGAEQLPWVGCLYGILQLYVFRHCRTGNSPGAASTVDDTASHADACALHGISRILLLNCHSFGWLDHVGSDEYERSHRRLYQAREALSSLLEDQRYRSLGRPSPCALCSATSAGGDASTALLLGDTIVMEGGVPSLGLARPPNTFVAHYQYGRGIACCVPELSDLRRRRASQGGGDGQGSCSSASASSLPHHSVHGDVEEVHPEATGARSRSGLCALHAESSRQRARRSSPQWCQAPNTASTPPSVISTVEEEGQQQQCLASSNTRQNPWFNTPPHVITPPSPVTPISTTEVTHLAPVCCGVCRAAGVLGQAVLLGCTGPLVIHLQFEEREWVEAAAPLLLGGSNISGSGGSWSAMLEDTVVCPAPLPRASGTSIDPAAVLEAVLYAQMQGHDTTRLPQQQQGKASPLRRTTASMGGTSFASSLLPPPPPAPSPNGSAVSLAEFVEWLVRLLHAPPPALVVEWHSGSSSSFGTSTGMGVPRSDGVYLERGQPSNHTTSVFSSSSPEDSCALAHSPGSPSSPSAVQQPHQHVDASGITEAFSHAGSAYQRPFPSSARTGHEAGMPSGYLNHPEGEGPVAVPSAPLGMSVRPRRPVVPQLLDTYADVFLSRTPHLPSGMAGGGSGPLSAELSTEQHRARTSASPVVPPGKPCDLSLALADASSASHAQDQVLLEWVLSAREALQPCEATAYFDGVERPLALAKQLEVVAEGERYVSANSVVTSLQYRPRPTSL